jgi:hypothetical protein
MLLRLLLTALLLAHAVAHLPGFLVPWKLATLKEMPYRTTVLGGLVDVGPESLRVVALLWLAKALALVIVAGAVILRASWWYQALLVAVGVSLILCVLGWPDSRLGVLANLLVLILAFFVSRTRGLP